MFGLDAVLGAAGGLAGGGGGPSSAKGEQNGNSLSSGTAGDFTVGGPSSEVWLWLALGMAAGWLLRGLAK